MDAQPGNFPMPGESLAGGIVIASVWYREADDDTIPGDLRDKRHNEDLYTLVILNPEPPYYTVGTGGWIEDGTFEWDCTTDHANIVMAINGDDGYVNMGGDI